MLNIGWGEMAVIAVVTLIVVGPKELPNVLRTGAHWMRQIRKMSREFQSGVDSLVREAELEDAKKIVTSAKQGTIKRQIETAIDPTGEVKRSLDPKQLDREVEADMKAGAKKIAPSAGGSEPTIAAPAPATPAPDTKPETPAPAATVATPTLVPAEPAVVAKPAPAAKAAATSAAPAASEPARKTGS
jgi:sec-independent protein translocase protein TatB